MKDNSLRTASLLGVLNRQSIVRQGFVGQRDRVDFYRFRLNRSHNVKLGLTGLQANADLMILNSRGRALMPSNRSGNQDEQIQMALSRGLYYVKVRNRGKGTRYRLAVSTIAYRIWYIDGWHTISASADYNYKVTETL